MIGEAGQSGGRHEALEPLDRRIAAALQLNGRATWREVSSLLDASETTVARRAKEMISRGFLRPTVLIDPVRCGWGRPVIVQMNCEASELVAITIALAARTDVRFVARVTGPFDVVAELIAPSRRDLARILTEEFAAIPGIHRTTTQAVTRNFKMSYGWARDLLPKNAGPKNAGLPPEQIDGEASGPIGLDEIDQRMLLLLRDNARQSHQELASELGIGASVARRKLDRLISERCLRPVTFVDPALLGYEVESFVWLHVNFSELEKTANALSQLAGVRYLSATAGFSDLVAETVLRTQEDLYLFQTEVLGSLLGIREAEMAIELSTVKRAYMVNSSTKQKEDEDDAFKG